MKNMATDYRVYFRVVFCLFMSTTAVAQTSVFMNEIHYDNTGTDAGEAIEIAGPAGTNLTGWSIVLYNGATGLAYKTTVLSGTIPNLGGGFGVVVVNYAVNGIQNGAPDGMALIDNTNTVLQFLSYEGSFTAGNGPVNGLTSSDIGVSEGTSEPVGNSLQLSGAGSVYEDFTWNSGAANTFGAFNTGQTFSGGVDLPPSVSSTNPANSAANVAVDANIEINFSEPVNVSGSWFSILATSSGAHTATVSGGPQNFTLNPDTDFSNGETVTVTIFSAQVTDQDANDPPDNMDADFSFSFTTMSAVTGIVINEIHADPDATNGDANGDGTVNISQDEFVEIYNNTGASLDISGWTLSDGFGVRHTFPASTVLDKDCAIVVFAGGAPSGAFGGVLVQTASSGQLGLNNTGDTVTLNNGVSDVATASYGSQGGDNQSLTLDPDITGASFVKHSLATGSGGALFSPGAKINGAPFDGCTLLDVKLLVFLAQSNVKIDGAVLSDGDIHSNGDIAFHNDEKGAHTGNLSALGDITIEKGVTIVGDAVAGDEIYAFGNITGTKDDHTAVAAIPLPTLSFTAGGPDKTAPKKGSLTLAPGAYGKVKVGKKATLFLSAGDYFMDELDTDKAATVVIDVSGGPVNINAVKDLEIDDQVEIVIVPNGESDSELVTCASMQKNKIDIGKKARVLGSIIAPAAEVHFSKGSRFKGAVCADKVTVEEGVPFFHHNSPNTLPKAVADESVAEAVAVAVPTEFALLQNYPNPFNPETSIRYSVGSEQHVRLSIYSITGQLVRTLVNGQVAQGKHSVVWDATDDAGVRVASGVYVYVIRAGEFVSQRKLVLMK